LDLAESSFTCIGQLDDREITTSLGKRLLMVLSPYVFLQLTPSPAPVDPPPETTLHWTPLSQLVSRELRWGNVTVDISSRLAPKDSLLKAVIKVLVGTMKFDAIILDDDDDNSHNTNTNKKGGWGFGQDGLTKKKKGTHGNFVSLEVSNEKYDPSINSSSRGRCRTDDNGDELRLWGLTLGMTMDLMSHMKSAGSLHRGGTSGTLAAGVGIASPGGFPVSETMAPMATSMTAVFPRFSYPDVNFWIWVFGKRYRQIIHGWEESISLGGANDRRWVLDSICFPFAQCIRILHF